MDFLVQFILIININIFTIKKSIDDVQLIISYTCNFPRFKIALHIKVPLKILAGHIIISMWHQSNFPRLITLSFNVSISFYFPFC